MRINIKVNGLKFNAELNESETAKIICSKLPIVGSVSRWGDEIYFEIPVHIELEEKFAKEIVSLGDLGFWPSGDCFCIFFGKTPASQGDEIRPVSAVNVSGIYYWHSDQWTKSTISFWEMIYS
ncbi:MAG: hypothetical protein KKC54_04175 [Nanoarchaeota archaeon]|nr:hypothetical protein [Nanoarchaeota archaeon]MBU1946139.1 hypothetical protein [Nanoarchaeota archaeon]